MTIVNSVNYGNEDYKAARHFSYKLRCKREIPTDIENKWSGRGFTPSVDILANFRKNRSKVRSPNVIPWIFANVYQLSSETMAR